MNIPIQQNPPSHTLSSLLYGTATSSRIEKIRLANIRLILGVMR